MKGLRSTLFLVGIFCLNVLLSSCGGGGGSSPAPTPVPAPTPAPTPTPVSTANCAYGEERLALGMDNTLRIEAENYDTCAESSLDTSVGNSGGVYREDDVDLAEDAVLFTNSYAVVGTETGEYLEYSIDVERSGLYRLRYRVQASASASSALALALGSDTILASEQTLDADTEQLWSTYILENVYLGEDHQTLRLQVLTGGFALDYFELEYMEAQSYTPAEVAAAMKIGINLGNTLDAYPNEGDWALPAQQSYFVAYKEAGFKHLRIPATWDDHVGTSAPYSVNSVRMNRTEQVVDWALAQGYFVILNAHHETWLKTQYSTVNKARFDAIWRQIAERFAGKSARLMFEILNEPNGLSATQVNELNARVLGIIRESNPVRLVVIAGHGYSPLSSLSTLAVPADTQLLANFHSYDPWPFAGQCTRRWGTQQDLDDLAAIYQQAKTWSQNNNIPVMVNEFGVAHYDFEQPQNVCDEGDRLAYLQAHVENSVATGIPASVWDDGGSFVIYDRESGTWGDEKDVLVSHNND